MKTALSRGVLLLAEHVLLTVASLIVGFTALRVWGPAGSGLLAQAQICVALTSVLATLVIDLPLLRRLCLPQADQGLILGSALALRLIAALLAGLLAWCLSFVYGGMGSESLVLLALFALAQVFTAANVFYFYLMAQERVLQLVAVRLSLCLSASALRLWLLTEGAPMVLYVASFALEAVLALLLAAGLLCGRGGGVRLRLSGREMSALLGECLPLMLAGLVTLLFLKVDVLLLSSLRSVHDVGIYVAALRVVEVFSAGLVLVLNQQYVTLARLHAAGGSWLPDLRRLFRLALAGALLIVLLHELVGRALLAWVLGPAYAQSIDLSGILVWSVPLLAVGTVRAYAFTLEGLNRYHPWCAGLGLLLLLPLMLLLVPSFGLPGAAAAVVLAQAVSIYLPPLLSGRLRFLSRMQFGF